MRIINKNRFSVFNLEDTNGRSGAYYTSLIVYLSILNNMQNETSKSWTWGAYPNLTQYNFYKRVASSNEFKNRDTNKIKNFKKGVAVKNLQNKFLTGKLKKDSELLKFLDKNIEQRSRHYTSNLVKLGLVDGQRIVTPVGKSLLSANGTKEISRSKLENNISIADNSLIILRQLAKFKVNKINYNKETDKTKVCMYSPFNFLIAALLKKSSIEEGLLFKSLSALTPYNQVNITDYIKKITSKFGIKNIHDYNVALYKEQIKHFGDDNSLLDKKNFLENIAFKNRKSGKMEELYYNFYKSNRAFAKCHTQDNLDKLLIIVNGKGKNEIKKRFNGNKNIFMLKGKNSRELNVFLKNNAENEFISKGNSNNFYVDAAIINTREVNIDEYHKSFEKLTKIGSVITSNEGIVSLTFPKFWKAIDKKYPFNKHIFETKELSSNLQENTIFSDFQTDITLEKIFSLSEKAVQEVLEVYLKSYGHKTEKEIKEEQLKEQNKVLLEKLKVIMPQKRLLKLLPLFIERDDNKILRYTTKDATVPTIFEWIVAIGWYYLSKNKYNLKKSMQLSLDTDGYPITQAPGQKNKDEVGAGDIIAKYKDRTVQLEATLMDKNAIKRGEWEPVLRHSANLSAASSVPVQTYFVTSKTDKNTENIWRSVAATDIEETGNKHRESRVIIYPVDIVTFKHWIETKGIDEVKIWEKIDKSYAPLVNTKFDNKWKQEILNEIG
ncbi:AlwI family type II restriction endonuclease [Lactobacillus sp. ESL0791]|uniref:AlwI family type II restriction endonuclease n=1 Tax=Lactobacillus sp. ESL0791 TaxID=2983234 RepID=UPI0023F63355|nr:AlwI family type II restriction endonuclease [Lactobacillus sp. ESL0791]MDF7638460.1 AlwI family type II restriction endonuclease [Lactobacillus sp. ESL0791]